MLKVKKFVSIILTFIIVICISTSNASTKVSAASEKVLSINWTNISKVGIQPQGSYSCSCYAMAYCRTILDGYPHQFYEYNLYSNDHYNVFAKWGWGGYDMDSKSTQLQVLQTAYDAINAGRPIIVYVNNPDICITEHWVTVVGYTGVSNYNNLSPNNFLIIDSNDSASMNAPVNLTKKGIV